MYAIYLSASDSRSLITILFALLVILRGVRGHTVVRNPWCFSPSVGTPHLLDKLL